MRILVKTESREVVRSLQQYGRILFTSSLSDVVGVEVKEKDLESIKGLEGVLEVARSDKGVILDRSGGSCK